MEKASAIKNASAQRMLATLSESTLLRQLFDEYERSCAELSEVSPTLAANYRKEVAADLFAVWSALSRLATYSERSKELSPEQCDRLSSYVEFINELLMSDNILRLDMRVSIDPVSRLMSTVEPIALEPMSMLDIMQGYGYDFNNEEGGPLAPFLWFDNEVRSPAHPVVKKIISDWLDVKRPLRVLDIGTGTCTSLLKVAPLLPVGTHFHGCDISGPILSCGFPRLMEQHIVPRLMVCDAQNLPYRSEAFDLVMNFGSIDQVADPRAALSEMLRVLRPGGLALCRDEYYTTSELPIHKRAWFKLFGPSFARIAPPMQHVPAEAKDVAVQPINELNFILSFKK